MTPDPLFWPDMGWLALLIVAAIVGEVFWYVVVGRQPPQEPGDVQGLARGITAAGCAGAVGIGLVCIVAFAMLASWGAGQSPH